MQRKIEALTFREIRPGSRDDRADTSLVACIDIANQARRKVIVAAQRVEVKKEFSRVGLHRIFDQTVDHLGHTGLAIQRQIEHELLEYRLILRAFEFQHRFQQFILRGENMLH